MSRNIFIIAVCTYLMLISNACHQKLQKDNHVIIAGKILNDTFQDEHATLEIHFRDLLESNENILVAINEDGSYRTEADCFYPQDFYIIYGSLAALFCSPGDSLFVEINADVWEDQNNRFPNGEYFVRVTGGTAVKINEHVIAFTNLKYGRFNWNEEKKTITESTPLDYKKHVYENEKLYLTLLDSFNHEHKTSKLFRKWAQDYIHYETWNYLMRYRWTHPMYNNISVDSIDLPGDYFSFLQEYEMNDNDLISISHNDFLHEYSMYVGHELLPSDSSQKAMQLYHNGEKAASYLVRLNNINGHTIDFTRDLLYAKTYANLLRWKMLEEFEEIYNPDNIQISFLRKSLEREYDRLKSFSENPQFIFGTNLQEISKDIVKPILDTLRERYSGKVMYIDFWAPWCGPCMGEMPHSKALQEKYVNQNVVFIFLAARCTEKSWKATIAEKQLTGEHFLLSDDQYNVLKARFDITGIPHYLLSDKSGKIISDNAPRPSEVKRLCESIDKLL